MLDPANGAYGRLHTLFLEDLFDAEATAPGLAKVRVAHDIVDVFPRLYCGQISRNNVPTLTHSFFDTSDQILEALDVAEDAVTCTNTSDGALFDAAFAIPLLDPAEFRTELVSYGSNKSFRGEILVRLYAGDGTLLESRTILSVEGTDAAPAPLQAHEVMNLDGLWDDAEGSAHIEDVRSVFLGFRTPDSSFPRRFKLGLNIAQRGVALGTNVCFAPLAVGPTTTTKPFNRRWMPVGGARNVIAWFSNTALAIEPGADGQTVRWEVINEAGGRMPARPC